ncbi:MAG: hypothetical protein EON56_03820 [Alphaproteobacteria bacterium]|nr:MAG: hypothetical protein EON56_03820 [Alphaproteobacteria bacterium]
MDLREVGFYLPYLWLRQGRSAWLVIPAALSSAMFAWMLSLYPTSAGHEHRSVEQTSRPATDGQWQTLGRQPVCLRTTCKSVISPKS